jgi:hypothetical protein
MTQLRYPQLQVSELDVNRFSRIFQLDQGTGLAGKCGHHSSGKLVEVARSVEAIQI